MEYLLIFLINKISLYGSIAYVASVLSLAGSRLKVIKLEISYITTVLKTIL